MSKKILLAGESWMSYTTHVKGFDAFYTSTYETGEKWFRQAMEAAGYDYTFLPNHEATDGFPFTVEELKKYDSEDIYVIGGEEIYREFLPYCDVAHVTKIDHEYLADAFFPDLDQKQDWVITADSEEQTYFDLEYTFLRYERRPKN